MAKKTSTNKRRKSRKNTSIPAPVADFDDAKYKVRRAADTLIEADEIRANKRFMKKVDAELSRKETAIKKARTRK